METLFPALGLIINIYRLHLTFQCQYFFLNVSAGFPPYLLYSLSRHTQFMLLSSLCGRMERSLTIYFSLRPLLGKFMLSSVECSRSHRTRSLSETPESNPEASLGLDCETKHAFFCCSVCKQKKKRGRYCAFLYVHTILICRILHLKI